MMPVSLWRALCGCDGRCDGQLKVPMCRVGGPGAALPLNTTRPAARVSRLKKAQFESPKYFNLC